MNRLRWIVFAAVVCMSDAAMAANWSMIDAQDDGTETWIDIDSIRALPIGRSSWVWEKYKTEKRGPNQERYKSLLRMHVAKCGSHELAIKSIVLYENEDRSGKVVGSFSDGDQALAFRPVVPGSIGEVIFNLTCPENSK